MDILNSINLELVKLYKERTVHIDRLPKGFKRPCFFLEFITHEQEDKNKNTVGITGYYSIICYEEVDEDFNSDTSRLIKLQSEVVGLFRAGTLAVSDRIIRIEASSSGKDEDACYIDLKVVYMDDRGLPKENFEQMGEVITKIKEE